MTETDMNLFKKIAAAAQALDCSSRLGKEVSYLVNCGEVNASDTIHVEKAAPEGDFFTLAISSIQSMLCFSDDREVCDWFAAQGLEW